MCLLEVGLGILDPLLDLIAVLILGEDLTLIQQAEILSLLEEFKKVVTVSLDINQTPDYPQAKLYRSEGTLENSSTTGEMVKQIKKILDYGVIEELASDWSSPIVLLPKPDHFLVLH